MPKSSDLGQLKPKWMNGSRKGPFELVFKPHIEKQETEPVGFQQKKVSRKN